VREIGIREAKARLSHVLHDVQAGAEWLITDRGKPVARIVPVGEAPLTLSQRLRILEDRGIIEPSFGDATPIDATSPLPVERGLAQRLLQEDRDGGH